MKVGQMLHSKHCQHTTRRHQAGSSSSHASANQHRGVRNNPEGLTFCCSGKSALVRCAEMHRLLSQDCSDKLHQMQTPWGDCHQFYSWAEVCLHVKHCRPRGDIRCTQNAHSTFSYQRSQLTLSNVRYFFVCL